MLDQLQEGHFGALEIERHNKYAGWGRKHYHHSARRFASPFQREKSRTYNFNRQSRRNGYYQYNRQNRFSQLKCRRSNGVSFQSIGNPKTVDATLHAKAQGAFNLEDGGRC
jgi:hypothetical protein